MKKLISVFVLLLISASTLSNYATYKIYAPIVMKSAATATPTPTFHPTETPTLTTTPEPGGEPIITYFTAWRGYGNAIEFRGTVTNMGSRPIDTVKIKVVVNGWCFYGYTYAYIFSMIQPGNSADFSGSTIGGDCNLTVTASIESWVEH